MTTVKDTTSPEATAGLITAFAIIIAMLEILILNLPPYARLIQGAIATAFNIKIGSWVIWSLQIGTGLAYALGAILLLGIQAAEVRPILLNNPSVEKYERVKWLSLVAYLLDLILGWLAWPPVADITRWWVTKSLADINYVHVVMIISTVYGFSWLTAQLKKLSQDYI
jgi:hypothetical protein